MKRSEFVRRIVLDHIANDYENVDQTVLGEVADFGARCGLVIERPEVVEALAGLIETGLAKAYLLSNTAIELPGMPAMDVVEEDFQTYFYVTKAGKELIQSDETWWPFDARGDEMQMDPEYLREHYASLSGPALRAIDRASLVEIAQQCYDDELRRRSDEPDSLDAEDQSDWIEDAAEVWSWSDLPGTAAALKAAIGGVALRDAGIPYSLDLVTDDPDQTNRWRLRVPGKLNLRATSVLECAIQNPEFEDEWKTHLEALSDAELHEMNPEVTYAGLMDRIERVTRVYNEEIARRKLEP
jgi:hypothetical protein